MTVYERGDGNFRKIVEDYFSELPQEDRDILASSTSSFELERAMQKVFGKYEGRKEDEE